MVPREIGSDINPAIQIKMEQTELEKDVRRRAEIAQTREQPFEKIKMNSFPMEVRP
jgi:hypothetical protein